MRLAAQSHAPHPQARSVQSLHRSKEYNPERHQPYRRLQETFRGTVIFFASHLGVRDGEGVDETCASALLRLPLCALRVADISRGDEFVHRPVVKGQIFKDERQQPDRILRVLVGERLHISVTVETPAKETVQVTVYLQQKSASALPNKVSVVTNTLGVPKHSKLGFARPFYCLAVSCTRA